jgi:WD40 repeat protein
MTQIYVGLSDGGIKLLDFGSGQTIPVGQHSSLISSLTYSPNINGVISTACEPNIYIWQNGHPQPVMTIDAANKVFCADFKFPILVAGTAKEKILLMDVNRNQKAVAVSNDLG